METSAAATPPRPLNPTTASPSASPSPASLRLWRSAAHRNLRNQWSHLLAAKDRWLAAAADGLTHAKGLVNAETARRNLPMMDLGVLKDMPGIRDKASGKLARQGEQYGIMLLSDYKKMVLALSDLVKASRSMRCFSKASANGSVTQYSDCQDDSNDLGDGGGALVTKWFSISQFESLAHELVEMFVSELKLKRLLVLELLSISFKEGVEHQMPLDWADELYDGESSEFQNIGLQSDEIRQLPQNWRADISGVRPGNNPSYEALYVYLATWLANLNIKMRRVDEIFELVGEEMKIKSY